MTDRNDIIHDWNLEGPSPPSIGAVHLHDETLRDGLQSPSVRNPDLEQKVRILRLLHDVGVQSASLGLPGASPQTQREIVSLLQLMHAEGLRPSPAVAARTHPHDLDATLEVGQKAGLPFEVMMFLGCSPIRMMTERWDEATLESLTRQAVRRTLQGGLTATFVTEDTTRSRPETLRRLFTAAIEEGATGLILCDTVGHATPSGVQHLVTWTDTLLKELGARDRVTIDWHGHDDRGLALVNGLAAANAGADRVHATVMGIGERVGNTPLDLMLVNLKMYGAYDGDLAALNPLVQAVSDACQVPIPVGYPVFGADAFRTGTGVHAAAIRKALQQDDPWLAHRVYSAVPANWVGRSQEIEISYMSGASNIRFWLDRHGYPSDAPHLIQAILDLAKRAKRRLADAEIHAVVEETLQRG